MSLETALNFSKEFVENVLEKESGFSEMFNSGDCSLLLLTGTQTEGAADDLSDVDIFLVCPLESQRRYKLNPVRLFEYKNSTVEVSVLSTEKLYASQKRKSDIHWWHHCYVIKSFDLNAEKALDIASTLSKSEFLDRLWTNYVYFKINTHDLDIQIKRCEEVSVWILFNNNIKLVIDTELACASEFPSWKQSGRNLRDVNKILYNKILKIFENNNYQNIKKHNKALEIHLVKILHTNGFTTEEINHWEDCNLERIIFQYQ